MEFSNLTQTPGQHFDIPKIDLSGDFELSMNVKNNRIKYGAMKGLEQGVWYEIRQTRTGDVTTCTATSWLLVNTKHPITGKSRQLRVKRVVDLKDGVLMHG